MGQNASSCAAGYASLESLVLNLTLSNFNFTQNCEATVQFWDLVLSPASTAAKVASGSYDYSNVVVDDFRTFLSSAFSDLSEDETRAVIPFALFQFPSLAKDITTAATSCQPYTCRVLGFTGNADIAGKGVSLFTQLCVFQSTLIDVGTGSLRSYCGHDYHSRYLQHLLLPNRFKTPTEREQSTCKPAGQQIEGCN